MSLTAATQITAAATVILAAGAIVTAILAGLAFGKQAEEVRTIQQQVTDEQELTHQQAELLKVQARQLELQRQQLDDQRKANARQAEVFELQARELRESLDERMRHAEQARRAQASSVFIAQRGDYHPFGVKPSRGLTISVVVTNASDEPVYCPELRWHCGSASHGDPNPESLPTILPSDDVQTSREFPPSTSTGVSGAVLTFRDAAGITWMRTPGGELTEVP